MKQCEKSDGDFKIGHNHRISMHLFVSYFQYYDADASGCLEPEEFRLLYDSLIEQGYSLEDFETTLAITDRAKDGKIHFNELLTLLISKGVFSMDF